MLSYQSEIHEMPLVAIDLETTGGYPIGDEICEIGLLRVENGKLVEEYQTLVRPRQKMSAYITKIHGISNEMVEFAPRIEEVLPVIYPLLKDAIVIAHHAPFDLGFLAYAFEQQGYDLPQMPVLCSSLLSRKLFPEASNHRLQTLIEFFELDKGIAHRALDDAKACLEVAKRCFARAPSSRLKALIEVQGKKLLWDHYSIASLKKDHRLATLIEAIENKQDIRIDYDKGASLSRSRPLRPWGIVRNPEGDFLQALCLRDNKNKRFYLNKIRETYSSASFRQELD